MQVYLTKQSGRGLIDIGLHFSGIKLKRSMITDGKYYMFLVNHEGGEIGRGEVGYNVPELGIATINEGRKLLIEKDVRVGILL